MLKAVGFNSQSCLFDFLRQIFQNEIKANFDPSGDLSWLTNIWVKTCISNKPCLKPWPTGVMMVCESVMSCTWLLVKRVQPRASCHELHNVEEKTRSLQTLPLFLELFWLGFHSYMDVFKPPTETSSRWRFHVVSVLITLEVFEMTNTLFS